MDAARENYTSVVLIPEVPMLGRADPQMTLLDTASWYGHLVQENSFYAKLARLGEQIVRDEDFAECYSEGRGRPSIPPSLLMRACLLAVYDRTSDRETARRCRADLDWKLALGLPIDHPGFHPTTFSVFRSRILLHDKDEALFRTVVERAVEAGLFPRRTLQLIDSSPVLGAGAVKDTYELLRGAIRKLATAAGEGSLSKRLRRRLKRYLKETKPRIDWADPVARRTELGGMVEAADHLLKATEERPELAEAASLLRQIVAQDVDREPPDGGGPGVRRGVERDRVVSVSDPEMRHGRKSRSQRFSGYKLHLVEEPASEIITAVEVSPANASDGDLAAPLVRQAEQHGTPAKELVGDMAYGDGDTRVEVAEAGATVIAKLPPKPNTGRFTKDEFEIDPEAPSATCPQGVTTTRVKRAGRDPKGRPVRALVFPAAACNSCPIRDRCTGSHRPREIKLHYREGVLQQARRELLRPSVRRKLLLRPGVERKVDEFMDHGMRKARYRGRRRVLLQARLTGVVVNLKRLFTLEVVDEGGEGMVPLAA